MCVDVNSTQTIYFEQLWSGWFKTNPYHQKPNVYYWTNNRKIQISTQNLSPISMAQQLLIFMWNKHGIMYVCLCIYSTYMSSGHCMQEFTWTCPLAWRFENTTMTSLNENIFRATGPLWGESIGHQWIPLTKASDAELWCFLWSVPQQTIKQAIDTPVIWDAISLSMTSM